MEKVIQLQDLQPGTSYLIRARAINKFGVVSEWSQTFTLNVINDDLKPSIPAAPTIQIAGPQKIVVSHDNTKDGGGDLEYDIAAYKVFENAVDNNTTGTLIHTMSATRPGSGLDSFATVNVDVKDSDPSATRYYYVTAVDVAGNESDPSPTATGVNITFFESAYISDLTADKIKTGTLQANESISVGTLSPIIIKSNAASPRGQIYIGAGNYAQSDTAFYVDSTGKFSLKDALTWDGTTLSINGYLQVGEALETGDAADDVNNNPTTIVGDKIRTGNLISNNYLSDTGSTTQQSSTFTQSGTWIDLDDGSIYSKNFYIDTQGSAIFKGNIFGSRGIFNGELPVSQIPGLENPEGARVPTVIVESTNTDDGYLVFFKNVGTDSGMEFYVKQGNGTNWRRGSLAHLDDVSGGFLRLGAFPSSTGITPGRIRIFAENTPDGKQGEIYLDAKRTYAQKLFLTEPSTTGDWTIDPVTNFWKDPDGVSNGSNYFKVGSTIGSAITVKKDSAGLDKVIIKNYEIEGAAVVIDDSRIDIGGIKIGRNINSTTKDGIVVDSNNYWYDPNSISNNSPTFKVSGGSQSITVNKNQNIVFSGTISNSISTGPIQTPTGFLFGKDIIGSKDGLYFNQNNFWILPNNQVATGEVFFQIAGGASQGTYIQIKKGTTETTGDVYIKGYYAGGQITEPITTPPTDDEEPGSMSLGADVDGDKDGLKLSDNNYWYVPESVTDGTAIFRVGGSTNFLSYNPNGDVLSLTGSITATSGNIGSWLIGTDSISSTGSPTYPVVLKNDISNPKIYIGAGAHASTTTPFYADSQGRFSIGDKLFFDPSDSQSFGTLTIIGRIRGAIDNIPIVPTDSGNFTVSSVVISGTTPNQSAVLTTTQTHTFAVGDTVIISGLTNNSAAANGAWAISGKTTNTFTIIGISDAINGTYTGQSGTARVRELTMGLHPALNGSPAGLGIRMDEYNYWFVNNQFRVGTSGSYLNWDGASLTVRGRVEATSGFFPAGLITGQITASQINATGLVVDGAVNTRYLNTVGGVDSFNVRVSSSFNSSGSAFVGFYNSSNTLLGLINSNSNNALNISGLSTTSDVTLQSSRVLFLSASSGIQVISNMKINQTLQSSVAGADYRPTVVSTSSPTSPGSYPDGSFWVVY